jgi:hypothetical protein
VESVFEKNAAIQSAFGSSPSIFGTGVLDLSLALALTTDVASSGFYGGWHRGRHIRDRGDARPDAPF